MAGKRQGTEDARHLWPEMLRAIRECRPTWIVGENVPGLINWSKGLVFEQVCADLEGEGYEVQPVVLPASGVNAPHRRDRVWFVAYLCEQRCNDRSYYRQERYVYATEERELSQSESERNGRINRTWEDGSVNTGLNTNATNSGVESLRSGRENTIHGFGNAANAHNKGMEGQFFGSGKTERPIREKRFARHSTNDGIYNWTDWPTVAPIRHVNDGVSGIMVRNIKSEVYGKISENYAVEDLQKVWDCFQSEEVREQIRGLYKIHGEGILLQTLQLCQAPNIGQGEFSPFGEDASKGLLRKLSKYGEFGRSPQGLELEKQFTGQFGNTLPYLSHEIALAAKEIEKECIKFASWHRNESIKAGGNAMVPELALMIFKVIEQMNNSNN